MTTKTAAYAKLHNGEGKEHFITTWGPVKLNEDLHDVTQTVNVENGEEDNTAIELLWDSTNRRWKCTVRAEKAYINDLPYPKGEELFLESGDHIRIPNGNETMYFLLPRRSPDKGRSIHWDDSKTRLSDKREDNPGFCRWSDDEQIALVQAMMTFGYLRPVQVKKYAQLPYPIAHVHRMVQDAVYVTWMLLNVGYEKGFLGRVIRTEKIEPLPPSDGQIGVQPECMEKAGVTAEALANRIRTMLSLRWVYDKGADAGKAPKIFQEISRRATRGDTDAKWSALNDWLLVKDTHEHGYGPHYARMASIGNEECIDSRMDDVVLAIQERMLQARAPLPPPAPTTRKKRGRAARGQGADSKRERGKGYTGRDKKNAPWFMQKGRRVYNRGGPKDVLGFTKDEKTAFYKMINLFGVNRPDPDKDPLWDRRNEFPALSDYTDIQLTGKLNLLLNEVKKQLRSEESGRKLVDGFTVFCKQYRPTFEQHYGSNLTQVKQALSVGWQQTPPDMQEKYRQAAKKINKERAAKIKQANAKNCYMSTYIAMKMRCRLDLIRDIRTLVIPNPESIKKCIDQLPLGACDMPQWWVPVKHDEIMVRLNMKHGIFNWKCIFADDSAGWPDECILKHSVPNAHKSTYRLKCLVEKCVRIVNTTKPFRRCVTKPKTASACAYLGGQGYQKGYAVQLVRKQAYGSWNGGLETMARRNQEGNSKTIDLTASPKPLPRPEDAARGTLPSIDLRSRSHSPVDQAPGLAAPPDLEQVDELAEPPAKRHRGALDQLATPSQAMSGGLDNMAVVE